MLRNNIVMYQNVKCSRGGAGGCSAGGCSSAHGIVQRVPINIVHKEIADYLKSQSDLEFKSYNILKPIVLFIFSEKIKQIHQCKPEISFIL